MNFWLFALPAVLLLAVATWLVSRRRAKPFYPEPTGEDVPAHLSLEDEAQGGLFTTITRGRR